MADRAVHRSDPSSAVAWDSLTITAAEPLSCNSAIRVRVVAVPDGGSGRCTVTCWLPWTTFARSISTPGYETDGAATAWKFSATVANVGSTMGSESWT